MPKISQKGFAAVFIMVGLFILSAMIVAGSYYVKNFTQILKSQASEVTTTVEVNQPNLKSLKDEVASKSATSVSQPLPDSTPENIYFFDAKSFIESGSAIKKLNLKTEKEESYITNNTLEAYALLSMLPSPSLSKSIVSVVDKISLTAGSTIPVNKLEYFLCQSITCETPEKIDKTKVSSQLTYQNNWMINQWVHNSETKVLINAFSQDPNSNPYQRVEIAVLDLQTMEVKQLFFDYMNLKSAQYLDTANDILVSSNEKTNGSKTIITYNLIDNKRTEYPSGKIENYQSFNYSLIPGFGPYYVQVKKDDPISIIKNIEVYSVKGDLVSAPILPEENSDQSFDSKVYWSHTHNLFAIKLLNSESQLNDTTKDLFVYTKEGTLAGSIKLTLGTSTSPDSLLFVTFSKDEKNMIVTTKSTEHNNMKIYPVELNAKMIKEVKIPLNANPFLWL